MYMYTQSCWFRNELHQFSKCKHILASPVLFMAQDVPRSILGEDVMCVTQQAQKRGNTVGGGVCKSCALFLLCSYGMWQLTDELRVTAGSDSRSNRSYKLCEAAACYGLRAGVCNRKCITPFHCYLLL